MLTTIHLLITKPHKDRGIDILEQIPYNTMPSVSASSNLALIPLTVPTKGYNIVTIAGLSTLHSFLSYHYAQEYNRKLDTSAHYANANHISKL
jgi:hypothetical protein